MNPSPEQHDNHSPHQDARDALPAIFHDRSLSFYWRLLRWPLVIGLMVDGLLKWENYRDFALEFAHICVLFYVAAAFVFRYRTMLSESVFVGAITGALLGFFKSFFAFIFQFEFYLFFHIFYETFLWAIIGIISMGTASFFTRVLQKKFFKVENSV